MAKITSVMGAAFLGEPGRRFMTVSFSPVGECKGYIFFVPPFGEEMNRCRSLVANQARCFAELGYTCTVLDLYGTGDSEGELCEASLELWFSNIQTAIEQCAVNQSLPVVLWGLRLGALIAMDFSSQSSIAFHDMLLWQPVISGKRYVSQILRQRIAAQVGNHQQPETTKQIRQRIGEGQHVEVSGYTIGEPLIGDIEAIEPNSFGRLCSGRIFWMENTSGSAQELSVASRKAVAALQDAGNDLEIIYFEDSPIWQLHKREGAPGLLAVTTDLFR